MLINSKPNQIQFKHNLTKDRAKQNIKIDGENIEKEKEEGKRI